MGVVNLLVMGLRLTSLLAKFALTLFIARFLGLESLGIYGLITGANILLPVVFGLGLNYHLSRMVITAQRDTFSVSMGSFLLLVSALHAILALPALVYAQQADNLLFVALLLPVLYLDHLQTDSYQLLLNLGRPLLANLLLLSRSALWMSVFMVAAWLEPGWRNLEVMLVCWLLGLIVATIALGYILREWPWNWSQSAKQLPLWLRHEQPRGRALYFNSLAETASNYLDRYLISFFLSVELAGIYFFFWSIYSASHNLLFTGVVQFFRPRMVLATSAGEDLSHLFRSCWRQTLGMAVATALASGVTLHFILPWIDRPAIEAWFPLLGLIQFTLVIGILREVQKLVFYSQHRDDLLLKATLMSCVAALLLQFTLIPTVGLWGAGVAFLLTNCINYLIQRKLIRGSAVI